MVEELKTRKWVQRPSSRPPPSATEGIEEIVGTGRLARSRNVPRSLPRNSYVLSQGIAVSLCSSCLRSTSGRKSKKQEKKKKRKKTYSSLLIPARSFKSAPAQNAASLVLPRTSALVGPVPPSADIDCTCLVNSSNKALDRAFLASGLFSSKTRIFPDPGAGTCCVLITASSELVLYEHFESATRNDCTGGWRRNGEERLINRGGILVVM